MRILHFTDIHGNLEALSKAREYIDKSKPDLVLVGGDWIDGVFNGEELREYGSFLKDFIGTEEEPGIKNQLLGYVFKKAQQDQEGIKKIITPKLFHDIYGDEISTDDKLYMLGLVNNPQTDLELRGLLQKYLKGEEEYSKFVEKGKESMIKQYTEMKDMLKDFPFLTVPGNHDGPCLEEVMANEYLHLKAKEINGIRIAGYGGASAYPMTIPHPLLITFKEKVEREGNKISINSEPYIFFSQDEIDPQIVLVHEMPHGLVENGSVGIRQYIHEGKPYLVFAGHYHAALGIYRLGDQEFLTYVINPGCFGQSLTYAEVELRDERTMELFPELITEEERVSPESIRIGSLEQGTLMECNPREGTFKSNLAQVRFNLI